MINKLGLKVSKERLEMFRRVAISRIINADMFPETLPEEILSIIDELEELRQGKKLEFRYSGVGDFYGYGFYSPEDLNDENEFNYNPTTHYVTVHLKEGKDGSNP